MMAGLPYGRPEFSRVIAVGALPAAGCSFRYAATGGERIELAKRLDLSAIHQLSVVGTVTPEADGSRILLRGQVRAEVTQMCVVTLEPLDSVIEIPLERLYANDVADEWGGEAGADVEIVLSRDLGPAPEPLPAQDIDIGEAAAEELALAVDPFPRAPGAVFEGSCGGDEDDAAVSGPFSRLDRLVALRNKGK